MGSAFFKTVSIWGLGLAAVAAAGFSTVGWAWSAGVLVSAFWAFLNSFFLFRLIQIGMRVDVKRANKILWISILKFPVLYVAGFFILKSRFFPIVSLLVGLSLFTFSFGAVWVRSNFGGRRSLEKSFQ